MSLFWLPLALLSACSDYTRCLLTKGDDTSINCNSLREKPVSETTPAPTEATIGTSSEYTSTPTPEKKLATQNSGNTTSEPAVMDGNY